MMATDGPSQVLVELSELSERITGPGKLPRGLEKAPRPLHIDSGGSCSYLNAEISASAVRSNLRSLRSLLAGGVKLCPVVKANCYGHGIDLLLETIARNSDFLAVATAQEALHLRQVGYRGELLMFFSPWVGDESDSVLAELLHCGITLTIVRGQEIDAVARVARAAGATASVHLMVDTGMARSGAPAHLAPALAQQIRGQSNLKLTGMYTHFACADEADESSVSAQLDSFTRVVDASGGRKGLLLHAANSSATVSLPRTHLDMVRPGIAVYGHLGSDAPAPHLSLRPALRLTGRLMQVKDVPAGSSCGYGLTYTFERPSRVGLVPIGYADGYPKALSNIATMRIAGRDAPVRGRVSMDQTIIDLTGIEGVAVGDEVEIISADTDAPHSVENLARAAGMIPYEILCGLGERIHRRLVG
ncbi:MAG: alanine racemase [Planctomycetes bacterium]|nr:alanine racemase [Planctomycetota bacterium]